MEENCGTVGWNSKRERVHPVTEEKKTFSVEPPKKGEDLKRQLADYLLATREGDSAAENNLYATLYPFMKAECRRICTKSPEDAEDALQNTMLHIMEKLDDVKDPEALLSWCYQVCYTTCLNYIEKQKKYNDLPLDDREWEDLAEEDIPGFLMEQEDVEALGQEMVEDLPEKQAAVYAMLLEGSSEADIAEALDMPLGSVKSSRRYGKDKLQREARRREREENVRFRGVGENRVAPILAILLAVFLAIGLALGLQLYSNNTPASQTERSAERDIATPRAGDNTTTTAPMTVLSSDAENPGAGTRSTTAVNANVTPNPGGGGAQNATPNTAVTVAGQQYIRPDGRLTGMTDSAAWSDIANGPISTVSQQLNALGPVLPDSYRKPYIASAESTFEDDILKVQSIIVNFSDHTVEVLGVDDYIVPTVDGRELARGSFVFDKPIRIEGNSTSGAALYFPEGYYDKSLAKETQSNYLQGIYELSTYVDNSYRVNYRIVD